MSFHSKLEFLSLASFSNLGAYPRAPEKCSTREGSGLPTNIRLDWKSLPGANTVAYYKMLYLTAVKSFITLAPM